MKLYIYLSELWIIRHVVPSKWRIHKINSLFIARHPVMYGMPMNCGSCVVTSVYLADNQCDSADVISIASMFARIYACSSMCIGSHQHATRFPSCCNRRRPLLLLLPAVWRRTHHAWRTRDLCWAWFHIIWLRWQSTHQWRFWCQLELYGNGIECKCYENDKPVNGTKKRTPIELIPVYS